MKITGIELERLRLPLDPPFFAAWDPDPRRRFDATIVRVRTDEGLTGIGSGDTMSGFATSSTCSWGARRWSCPPTPARSRRSRFTPGASGRWRRRSGTSPARRSARPVATLLGGSAQRIAAYASLGELRPPDQRADDAHALVAAGFRAVKVRIARDRIDEGIAVVAAMRDAVGDALEIMVDLNQWWRMAGDIAPGLGPQAARRVIDRLAEHGVLWVEEPLAGDDLAGMAMLRAQTGVRIAGGEMARDFDELRRALERDALDVVQPDVVLALGISGTRTLAELALRRNRWFTPHTWTNGIGVLANLHVCCGVGGGPFLEFPYDPPGWTPERRDFMLAEPVRIDADGMLSVGTAPGLGIELDEEAVAHYRLGRA